MHFSSPLFGVNYHLTSVVNIMQYLIIYHYTTTSHIYIIRWFPAAGGVVVFVVLVVLLFYVMMYYGISRGSRMSTKLRLAGGHTLSSIIKFPGIL